MSQRYGFFNAVLTNGEPDRVYTADDINDFFQGVLSDGVYRNVGNSLAVTANNNMSVNVNTGKALVKRHWLINDAVQVLSIEPAHATLKRYTTIALRYTKAERKIEVVTINGEYSSSPVYPALTQNDEVYELALYHVLVNAGVTSISNSDLTDARTYVCGLVDPTPLNYRRHNYIVASSSGEKYFNIPETTEMTLDTKLEVYCNGLLCSPDEYSIEVNEVEGSYMVVFPDKKSQGAKMCFVLIN